MPREHARTIARLPLRAFHALVRVLVWRRSFAGGHTQSIHGRHTDARECSGSSGFGRCCSLSRKHILLIALTRRVGRRSGRQHARQRAQRCVRLRRHRIGNVRNRRCRATGGQHETLLGDAGLDAILHLAVGRLLAGRAERRVDVHTGDGDVRVLHDDDVRGDGSGLNESYTHTNTVSLLTLQNGIQCKTYHFGSIFRLFSLHLLCLLRTGRVVYIAVLRCAAVVQRFHVQVAFHLIAGRQHSGRIQTGHAFAHHQIFEFGLAFGRRFGAFLGRARSLRFAAGRGFVANVGMAIFVVAAAAAVAIAAGRRSARRNGALGGPGLGRRFGLGFGLCFGGSVGGFGYLCGWFLGRRFLSGFRLVGFVLKLCE